MQLISVFNIVSFELTLLASQHLKKLGSKKLSDFINQIGPINIPSRFGDDPLMGLCQIVVSQQLSTAAAKSIWVNICNSFPNRDERLFALRNNLSAGFGLSRAKQRTLKSLTDLGDEWLRAQINDPQISRNNTLTQLWGIGPWSVAMWELFVLKNPDIWTDEDLILKRISEVLAGKTQRSRLDWIESAAPYRSFLALYCWKLNNI